MKVIIEKGYVVGVKEEKWSSEDGRSGSHYFLCVKEKVGEGEFGTVMVHELGIRQDDRNMFESYKDKIVSVTGTIFTRKSKDRKTSFYNTLIDTIEIV